MERKKRQHSVPRGYLKRFTDTGTVEGKIWCLNKDNPQKPYHTGLMNVAHDNYFYDLPPETMAKITPPGQPIDFNFVENLLAGKDAQLAQDLNELLPTVEKNGIPPDWRYQFAPLMIIQWLRTRAARELIYQRMLRVEEFKFKKFLELHHPELSPSCGKFIFDRDELSIFQAKELFKIERNISLAEILVEHIWIVWVNQTCQPFYTSDEPVLKMAKEQADLNDSMGFKAPGLQVLYPLSSRYLLAIYDRKHFPHLARFNNRPLRASVFQIEECNTLQVKWAYRQIFCEKKEFEQAQGACRRYPELCNPDRERVWVEESPNEVAKAATPRRGRATNRG